MSKSKKGNVVQMLSPENYIRKKARTLPIFECLISSNWEEHGLPTVVIARKHTNGNITACTYMVDLHCLGVKDSAYLFNVPMSRYSEFKEFITEEIELTEVDYTLVHNIVLAGIEYAEELGFKPYKDYESVTKFMLEEDTDEIELIEIECGLNGKPFYVQGPHEDMAKVNRIVAQLEKAVGHGNYNFLLQDDEQFNDPFEEDELEDEDEFKDWTFKEKKDLFLVLTGKMEQLQKEEALRLMLLIDSIVEDLVDNELRDQYYDELIEPLDMEISDEVIPDQLLGPHPEGLPVKEEWKTWFLDLFELTKENTRKSRKEIKLFKDTTKGIPGACFLEVVLLLTEKSSEYEKRVEEYARLYPDYALIQLMWDSLQVNMYHEDLQSIPGYPFSAEKYFAGRDFIHSLEIFYFMTLHALITRIEMNINKIDAFEMVLFDLFLPEEMEQAFSQISSLQKMVYLNNYFKNSFE